jgi:hypothetical protein
MNATIMRLADRLLGDQEDEPAAEPADPDHRQRDPERRRFAIETELRRLSKPAETRGAAAGRLADIDAALQRLEEADRRTNGRLGPSRLTETHLWAHMRRPRGLTDGAPRDTSRPAVPGLLAS